jgi:DNA-binding GntR family transcriptional regulator
MVGDPPSLAALAAGVIRELIVTGELLPGERLIEARLTEQLGVSRPPLREALAVLAHEGLVQMEPRRGASVTALTVQNAFEVTTLRRSLEHLAVDLALPVRATAALARCRSALRTLKDHAAEGDDRTAVHDTIRFHTAFVALAEHGLLTATYRDLTPQIHRYMRLNRTVRLRGESLVERTLRHELMLEAAVGGDRAALHREIENPATLSFLPQLRDSLAEAEPGAVDWYRRSVPSSASEA